MIGVRPAVILYEYAMIYHRPFKWNLWTYIGSSVKQTKSDFTRNVVLLIYSTYSLLQTRTSPIYIHLLTNKRFFLFFNLSTRGCRYYT